MRALPSMSAETPAATPTSGVETEPTTWGLMLGDDARVG